MFGGPVLIANRGEIAVRVARTVHDLGLRSVAVFTDADAAAPHVDACDVAVQIGSYLDGAAVLDAARRTGAQAVHPGYGFLSENAAFARAVVDAGLTWVGPPPAAIELMGDKGAAKDAAVAAGVPVVPAGDAGGYPVVVKAVAGGGGKGMRVVRSADELEGATAAAKREAMSAFGDDRVIVERYLERPRHIEVQVLADAHGTVVHLGERECSLQRRHQKVVEEAPSPVVDAALRQRMGDAAVRLAAASGYEGAGTVEFIVPETAPGQTPGEFFFLEMNTRLQVEHPVTEIVYGVDLVEQQLRVAAGEPLTLRQDELVPRGHAIEARLYAEDPATGFLPSTGTIVHYAEPFGTGVRMDSGVRAGSEVGTQYDPMLAKVIASGEDRATALRRLDRALAELELLGVATNAAFTRRLLARADVASGAMDTGLLERVLAGQDPTPLDLGLPADLLPAAALAAAGTAQPPGPWRRRFAGDTAGEHVDVSVHAGQVTVDGRTHAGAGVRPVPGEDDVVRVTLDGVSRRYAVHVTGDVIHVARDGHHLAARTHRPVRSGAGALAGSLEAPMPGTVLLVHVANGDTVTEGDVLLVLESMKMELSITAPRDGTVEGLELAVGDRVALKQPLVAVVADGDGA
ncbi:MAG: ATP-grasp protein [Solirubrobacterales bacterium]|jgi:acetyl-CoA/propionyl-CoA carboxylase biotin carboxyl carrier protein|nr:ATP-grasp protein [Solirubrobacterales bacterium]